MKSIDTFRKTAEECTTFSGSIKTVWMTESLFTQMLDDIEREVEGYVELPKDADGEYIHIGDRVEDNERVVRIVLTNGSWEPSVYVEKAPCLLEEYFCNEVSHYKPPTVEDVLREFADRVCSGDHIVKDGKYLGIDDTGLLTEYAAKLQLREEG